MWVHVEMYYCEHLLCFWREVYRVADRIYSEPRSAEHQLGDHFLVEMKQNKINAFGRFTKFWDVKQVSPASTRWSCARSGSKDLKKMAISLSGAWARCLLIWIASIEKRGLKVIWINVSWQLLCLQTFNTLCTREIVSFPVFDILCSEDFLF